MTPFKRVIPAALLVLLASACASVPMATPQQDAEAKQFKAAADKANVYVYRNETMGSAIKFDLLVDGKAVGQTAAKTYYVLPMSPGNHVLTSKAENDVELPIKVEAGKNYFFWQEVKMGVLAARSVINPVDEATGRAGVLECKLAQVAPEGPAVKAGCTKAADCKGGRSCVQGVCVAPTADTVPST